MRDISCRLIWMKCINMLSVYAQSGTHGRFNWWIIALFDIETFCSDVCGDHRRPQTLAKICRNTGVCCGFRAVAAREKHPGFILLIDCKCWLFKYNLAQYHLWQRLWALSTHLQWLVLFAWRLGNSPSTDGSYPEVKEEVNHLVHLGMKFQWEPLICPWTLLASEWPLQIPLHQCKEGVDHLASSERFKRDSGITWLRLWSFSASNSKRYMKLLICFFFT